MTDPAPSPPTVLIVDDERDLADLYAIWLGDDYDVRTAYGGEEALEEFGTAVDVVLLDRRMPDLSGDVVLDRLRNRNPACQVVMVTAVDPDFDILEMGFDGYVTKPIDQESLEAVVEKMLNRRQYDEQLQTYYRLVAKRAALEVEKSEGELAANEDFIALQERITELESEVDLAVESFDEDDVQAAFRNFNSF